MTSCCAGVVWEYVQPSEDHPTSFVTVGLLLGKALFASCYFISSAFRGPLKLQMECFHQLVKMRGFLADISPSHKFDYS